jgi:hypothetical protein
MRRGSIAIGQIKCDNCSNTIEHGERYLILQDENTSASDTDAAPAIESVPEKHFCLNCCIKKKYVVKKKEKGEEIYTFFP